MKIKLLDLFKRKTDFHKKEGVIYNGELNDYAETTDRLVDLSVTAKMACGIMSNFIFGKGVNEENKNIIVFEEDSLSLDMFAQIASKVISKHRGIFIHINWNANFKIGSFKVLPYHTCRKGKKDNTNYNGKILVSKDWTKGHDEESSRISKGKQVNKDNTSIIDVFNPNKNVIQAQVDASEGKTMADKWESYKGQIWYFNPDIDFEYALSRVDSVMSDCDSEAQSSVYKNRSLRKGFFGKTMMITKPMVQPSENYGDTVDGRLDYERAITEEEEFTDTAKDWLGAENSGNLIHVQLDHNGDNFDEVIKIEQIASDINDKLFEYTEKSVFQNILMAFNNLPGGLVRSENTMFGNSGEMLRVMKESYQENVVMERQQVTFILNRLMKLFKEPKENIELIPLIEIKEVKEEKDDTIN